MDFWSIKKSRFIDPTKPSVEISNYADIFPCTTNKIMDILQKANRVSADQIRKANPGSEYIVAENKEGI